jgi:hypothetical protein
MDTHGACSDPHTTLEGLKYVWLDDTLKINGKSVSLSPKGVDTDTIPISSGILTKGYHEAKIAFKITSPTELAGMWINATWPIYATLKEDLNLDYVVDYLDINPASRAFGSYPGHPRWNPICDLNGDCFIDYLDINPICRKFGWGV